MRLKQKKGKWMPEESEEIEVPNIFVGGDASKERDKALMNYYRRMCNRVGGKPFYMDPQELTNLWDSAFIAGVNAEMNRAADKKAPTRKKGK